MTTESQHKAPPAGLAGTVDHQDAGDGWTLVRLMTKQALIREGLHMDHCLQDGCYQDFAGEEELTGDAVWSLRDKDGVSWATLEIREGHRRDLSEPCLSNVIMAKGPGNRTVRRSVARRLQPLVLAFRAAGRELDFSGETELVMADDGRVMRKDQAPADIVEQSRARHVARVVKLQKPQGEGLREPMQLSRDEYRVLTLDTQAAFLRYGAGIPWSLEPLTSDRVAVEDVEQAEAVPFRLLPYQQAIVDALEPVYDPILPARMHQTEITCPEMPGARWVLTTSYGQTRMERAG